MNGQTAKKIRKSVYGNDMSHRARELVKDPVTGVVKNTGLRKDYQEAKKEYKKSNKSTN